MSAGIGAGTSLTEAGRSTSLGQKSKWRCLLLATRSLQDLAQSIHAEPRACTQGNLLTFQIVGTDLEATQVRGVIERTVREVQSYLTNLRANVSGFNGQLQGEARAAIEARRNKLLANCNTVASLGFKMKEMQSAPKTYAPPEIRKGFPLLCFLRVPSCTSRNPH